jgi:hypothetical protein
MDDGKHGETHGWLPGMVPYVPTTDEVAGLIDRAREHPLGTEFLADGALDAVAATFQVHAFVVEAARRSLGAAGAPLVETLTRKGAGRIG